MHALANTYATHIGYDSNLINDGQAGMKSWL
jgi:hypothetical protein